MSNNLIDNEIFSDLNEKQYEAVQHLHGPLLIIAGAGSGKTKALTNRIANLIINGIRPWNILALTFTNKAAQEMQSRIGKMIGEEQAKQIYAGTFHSIFARILRAESKFIGYDSNFSIYDTEDSRSIIKKICKEYNINDKELTPQALSGRISAAKNKMIPYNQYEMMDKGRHSATVAFVYAEYQRRLMENNAMDFDDLLLNMIKLLQIPEILAKYQERFKYILVDEYQDTNRVQYLIITQLAQAHQNICVVGDDSQSIYKWRGADIRNILDFQKEYLEAKIVKLEQNYRSTKNIIGAADSVIKFNKSQIPKTLWTNNPEGEKIYLRTYDSDFEESQQIANSISRLVQSEKCAERDFAILYRTNAQSLSFEKALKAKSLKYQVIGGTSFFSRKEIKDLMAYLKILVNPSDSESIMRIINFPIRGIGDSTINKVIAFAKDNNISFHNALRSVEDITSLQVAKRSAVRKFVDFVDNYSYLPTSLNQIEDIIDYLEATGVRKAYEEMTTDDSVDRVNNIDQLFADIEQYFISNENPSLEEYLQQSALITDADNKDLQENAIKLMTVHSSKGLEFPHVYIVGLEQGLFPLGSAEENPSDLEEERRLMYVAITRAEKNLDISYCRRRMRFGDVILNRKSRFIGEIDERYMCGDELTKEQSTIIKKKPLFRDENYSQIPPSSSSNSYESGYPIRKRESSAKLATESQGSKLPLFLTLKIGDKVSHKLFGVGVIESMSGIADNKQATVMFNSVGRKKLLIKYSGMTKL